MRNPPKHYNPNWSQYSSKRRAWNLYQKMKARTTMKSTNTSTKTSTNSKNSINKNN